MSSQPENKLTSDDQQPESTEVTCPYFTRLFDYTGTVENSAFFCVPAALDFRWTVCGGDEAIYEYIQHIAQAGADLIAKSLGTEVMDVVSHENSKEVIADIRQCAMANIRLPFIINGSDGAAPTTLSQPLTHQASQPPSTDSCITLIPTELDDLETHASWLTSTLIKEYHVGVTVYPYNSHIWLRVSGQIYLELSDFDRLAEITKLALERVRKGESIKARA